jgi:hypothetical protein
VESDLQHDRQGLIEIKALRERASESFNLSFVLKVGRDALVLVQSSGNRSRRCVVWGMRSAGLFAGLVPSALGVAETARALATEDSALGEEAWTLKTLADVYLARGATGFDAASGCYRKGLRIAEELQMRPLVAHCHAGLGRIATAMGQVNDAQPHVQLAREMYADMRMAFSAEPLGMNVQMPV